jgi:UPF0755 protein
MHRLAPRAGFLLAVLLIFNGCTAHTPESSERTPFRVERGASAREIAHVLAQEGYLYSPWTFLVWIKLSPHKSHSIHPGVYMLSKADTGYRIVQLFRAGPPMARVTFPEGWTSRQMAALLEARNVLPSAVFLEKVEKEKQEGYLFPDTYAFEQNSDVDTVIRTIRKRFTQILPPDWNERAKILHLSEKDLVTLASIVEREARVPAERPVIAGVFLNRLHKHWRLESCATVEYALGKWKPRLTYADLDVQSPYNTYRHGGLPPGPIGNPGAAALDAAAHPAQTDMMFFVAAGDGTHRFSQYYKQHLDVQKKHR